MKNILNNFPFETVRDRQEEVIKKLEDNWDKYKCFVVEAPTGFGKSPVANAIGMSVDSTFLLTSTKQLQNQYIEDFGSKEVVDLKGKANYRCNIEPGLNVECGPCTVNKDLLKNCKDNGICSYYTQREKTLNANIAVLNTSFFLYATTCGRYFKPRDVIIVDECHLLESQLVQWATTLISPTILEEEYDIKVPKYKEASGYNANKRWLNKVWKIIIDRRIELEEEIKEMLDGQDPNTMSEDLLEEVTISHSAYYKIDKLYKTMERFFKSTNKESWLCEPQDDGLIVTPVEVSDLFQRFIASQSLEKVVFMSATILDMVGFCKTFGIKKEEVGLLKVESEFPPEKSPIIYKPCGSMNMKNIDATMPNVIETIRDILAKHPNEKAVIHSSNYKIAEQIYQALNDPRLIIKQEGENNEMIIKKHMESTEPTVLLSPSLTTGTDLKDDLSRFQIIVKMPFLSLADQRVARKNELNNDWYVAEMLRTVVQAAGRSTRNENDWSVTYVLDSSFYYFIVKYRRWLSKNFLQRIKFKSSDFDIEKFKDENK
ncbi:DNA helicase [Bacillus phage G]|uniref:Gp73 n=1 Tax=Bacillus phage G TaxID=2884420 RepID=G3MBE3_9CAUD|nr:DNA helicase [Bacillus phage G]AEO93344.1 gp73 [Bacillus phage G]